MVEKERDGKRKERDEEERERGRGRDKRGKGKKEGPSIEGKVPLIFTECCRKAALQRVGPTSVPALGSAANQRPG